MGGWSQKARHVDELQTLVGQKIARVVVEADYDPSNSTPSTEADIRRLALIAEDGTEITVSNPGAFIEIDPTPLKRDSENHYVTFEPTVPTDPTEIAPGEGDCTCVGEIGEDPQCAVHGAPQT